MFFLLSNAVGYEKSFFFLFLFQFFYLPPLKHPHSFRNVFVGLIQAICEMSA